RFVSYSCVYSFPTRRSSDLVPDLLTFKTTYNHAYTSIEGRYVDLPFFIGDGFQRPDSQLEKTAETYSNQIWDNVLTYRQVFGKRSEEHTSELQSRENLVCRL